MEVKRQFFQIYTELDRLPFNGTTKTDATFRAMLLETLAEHGLREYIPKRKWTGIYNEDIVRLKNPEAEIKYGFTCQSFYIQVSVSNNAELPKLNNEILATIRNWAAEKEASH